MEKEILDALKECRELEKVITEEQARFGNMHNYSKGIKLRKLTATEIIAKTCGTLNVVSDKNGHLHVKNLGKERKIMDEQRIVVTYPCPVSTIGRISVGWRSNAQCELFVEGKIIKEKRVRMSYEQLLKKVLSLVER